VLQWNPVRANPRRVSEQERESATRRRFGKVCRKRERQRGTQPERIGGLSCATHRRAQLLERDARPGIGTARAQEQIRRADRRQQLPPAHGELFNARLVHCEHARAFLPLEGFAKRLLPSAACAGVPESTGGELRISYNHGILKATPRECVPFAHVAV
jgi:hypothetical protein